MKRIYLLIDPLIPTCAGIYGAYLLRVTAEQERERLIGDEGYAPGALEIIEQEIKDEERRWAQ